MKPKELDSAIAKLLMDRHADEVNAFYIYRSMSNFLKDIGFFKASAYFAHESEDELSHAKHIEDFLVDWNVVPQLGAIAKPANTFKGLPDCINQAYQMEYDLYEKYEDTSGKVLDKDICVFDFLKFFREIQTKSVAEYSDKLNLMDGVKTDDKFQLLMLEKKLFS